MTRFLSLDPSSTVSGWAVFDADRLVAWGKIDTKKVDYSFRYQFIVNEIIHLVQVYNVQEIALEAAVRWKGREISALKVTANSIKSWAKKNKVPLAEYNVSAWKTSVLGNCHISKEDTGATVRLLFPRLPADLGEHEHDAIGVGLYHAGILKLRAMRADPGPLVDKASPKERLSLAKVGLEALVDEATGFQEVRGRGDLAVRFRIHKGSE